MEYGQILMYAPISFIVGGWGLSKGRTLTFQLAIIIFYSVIIFPLQDFCMTPRSSFVHRSLCTSFSSLMVVYAADSEQTC